MHAAVSNSMRCCGTSSAPLVLSSRAIAGSLNFGRTAESVSKHIRGELRLLALTLVRRARRTTLLYATNVRAPDFWRRELAMMATRVVIS
jgi:hypothetical protein